ncbi:MAG TPA: insulinase family protein [Holophagaceae bacterium]|jgi:predicted Zn-dependent peptidase|nr:insulinase family protein [Holophagaceae bacterium]
MRPASALFLLPALLSADPAPTTFTLPNGLKVALFEDHSLPLLRGELRLDLPAPTEDGQAWLRPLGLSMLAAGGSGARNAAAFALGADAIGLELRLSPGPDAALWAFSTRSQDQEAALGLLADRVTRPAFDPLALEPARLAAWSELSESDALARARLRFARASSALPEPDERALGSVDAATLAAWHRRLFRPDRAVLVLWGDLDASQARQLVLLSFGAWTAVAEPASSAAPSAPEPGPFLAALPGEAPAVSIGLLEDGRDRAQRRFLRPWISAQLKAAGIALEEGDALSLRADAPLGTSAESLRARLAAALDALPASFTAADLAALRVQAATEKGLLSLHPEALLAGIAMPTEAPTDLAAAKALLDRWCAPSNRRLFASGDPGSLQGFQTSTPKR